MPQPRKLTPEEERDLLAWYASTRSVKAKARELGISTTALMDYVRRRHKEARPKVDIDALLEKITLQSNKIPRGTKVQGSACTQQDQS